MSQVIDAHREHIDKLTEINKSQALEILTLREHRDSLLAACKSALKSLGALKPAGPLVDTYMAIERAVVEVEGEK